MGEMDASEREDQVVEMAVLASVRLVCESLVRALSVESGIALLHHGTSVHEVAICFRGRSRAVLVYDGSSAESLCELRETVAISGAQRVVVFGLSGDPQQLRYCARLNVCGLVGRDASLQELVSAIKSVAREGHYAGQALGRALVLALATDSSHTGSALTDRENEVAHLLIRGDSSGAICRALDLRPGTLKSHVRSIYSKLGIHHRSEIVGRFTQGIPTQTLRD